MSGPPQVIVCMGVSGTGKSSVAGQLAPRLEAVLVEGDDFHPEANVRAMADGVPLTDADRWPWLRAVADVVIEHREAGRSVVATCSALKRSYRDLLRERIGPDVVFVLLDADAAVLRDRLTERTGHFMPASQLDDQLATLERPDQDERAVVVDVDSPLQTVVDAVLAAVETEAAAG